MRDCERWSGGACHRQLCKPQWREVRTVGAWRRQGPGVALPTMGNVCPAERKGDIGMLMAGVVGRSGETSSI